MVILPDRFRVNVPTRGYPWTVLNTGRDHSLSVPAPTSPTVYQGTRGGEEGKGQLVRSRKEVSTDHPLNKLRLRKESVPFVD